jgi:Ca-activated chloride channel family protein
MNRFNYLLIALILLLFVASAGAQTIIIPEPEQKIAVRAMPYIQETHVSVEMDAGLAKTTVELVVFNPGERIGEGTLLFPLPAHASVSDFYLWIGGKKVKGELLDKKQAAKIYQDIVRRMVDPALLEMTKYNVFKASIFPIDPKGTRRVSITYSEKLPGNDGLLHYNYLMKNRQLGSKQPMKMFSFEARLKAPVPITTAYSPSHDLEIKRVSDSEMKIGFEKTDYNPDRDLHFYAGYSPEAMAVYAARYSAPGDNRDFGMFILSPTPKVKETKRVEKDVVFVLDTSGSMQHDSKIEQAVSALKFGLGTLNDDDRFALISFSTDVRTLSDNLMTASDKNTTDAKTYLSNSVSATGSTNIHDALKKAFSMLDPGINPLKSDNRTKYVIFLTDGLPTAVERDPQKIIERAKEWAPKGVRLFTWGVGYDVDTILLDSLAKNHGGVSEYVKPKEEMEAKLGSFFQKISHPVMTNLEIKFAGLEVEEMYPRQLPDIFKGGQLTIFARLKTNDKGSIQLTGNYLGQQQEFKYEISPVEMKSADHIAHLWATRKIGFLLEEIRTGGETKELKEAVIELAKKHGIVTPYTSYLVTEPEEDMVSADFDAGAAPADAQPGDTVRAESTAANKPKARSGQQAVQYSKRVRVLKEEEKAVVDETRVKVLAGKTFNLKEDFWTDSEYVDTMKTVEISFGSDEYFELLNRDNRMATWLSAGKNIIVVIDKIAYKIIS